MEKDYCDGEVQCLDSGEDEYECGDCPYGLYPCYFDESICYNYTAVGCDGNYDCPGGTDEYNCTGCFACPGSSECLVDLQICNFYNDCPYGEDETEDLCKHSEYASNNDIQVGVWTNFSEGFVRERTLDGRDTPASEFYDFTHYVFESPEGSTLFLEIQNLTVNLTGPLLELVRIQAGFGTYPTDINSTLAYVDAYGNLESYSAKSTLLSNTGYLLIAMPKSVAGTFNLTFSVTAIECGSPEMPCLASLHCIDIDDYCDGEIQCLDSGEDEYGCEECFNGEYCWYEYDKCVQPRDRCNGLYDCASGSDETDCPGCTRCNGTAWCPADIQVCDYIKDCPSNDDEAESRCNHTAFIDEVDLAPGESITIKRGWQDGAYGDRDTPASNFYNFTHYVFTSPPRTTLFVEVQKITVVGDPGPLQALFKVLVGSGINPGKDENTLAYLGLYHNNTISNSIPDSVGYVLIAIPKDVKVNVTFRVTAVEPCDGFVCPTSDQQNCIPDRWFCDYISDCLDDSDESNCSVCPDGLSPCFFDESICYNYTAVGCDGSYDCPGGTDEYNCPGCFACNGSSDCLVDLQVCNFYNDCPYGEDEANNLCNHTEFKSLHDIQVGVWTDFSEVLVSQRILDGRDTPASQFYDFTHYAFESPEGSTLFMEIQSLTVNLTGPLLELVRVSAGYWTDPTDVGTALAYANGYGYFESHSYSRNFSLVDNKGYLLIAIPKSVAGTFNITFRVTAIECEYPEELCNGSLHCLNRIQETCDGEVQCLDSEEDEYGCEECFHGEYCWYEYKCVQPRDRCNGLDDCASASDEHDCPGCTPCNGTGWCPADIQVCDYIKDCPSGDDEAESRCNHTAFINEVNLAPGESITIDRSWLDGAYGDRDTPASDFYNFTHYVFNSNPGSTLFVEMQNITVDGDPSPLNVIFKVLVGTGVNPGTDENNVAYFGLYYNYTVSNSQNFSIPDSVGYVLIAIPKDVQANITFRVTAVECFEFSCPTIYPIDGNCISEDWVCDNITDCLDGSDEADCDVCPEGLYPCYFDDSICLNYTAVGCDGNYDCPGGTDEYNCTGCFACEGSTSCQYDNTVCDFFGHCTGGEDESEDLCRHSEFIQNVLVSTGQWVDITVTSGNVENRNTPASDFIDFTHYVFRGDPGTTLFMEIQNYTWSDGPLASLLRLYAGSGEDPTDASANIAFLYGDGYSLSLSDSYNFSLRSNIGYGLVGIPKDMNASIQLRVTAIACDETESLCIGSPHCVNLETDLCNGEYECVYSREDELNCDEGVCDVSCTLNGSSCLYPHDYCDDEIDCAGGEDEYACDSDCFKCPGYYTCIYDSVVCDFYDNCYGGADEAESLCRDSEYIIPVDVTTEEWITIEQRSGDAVEDRGTRASEFYDFYHYVFYADPGVTLFVELLNYTWSENAPQIIPLLRIIAGAGEDPASGPNNRAYYDATGYEYSISSSDAFSLTNSTGFVLLAFPKNVEAYVEFRVTAIECVDNSTPCNGSLHCYDPDTEECDGTVQCIDSGEDEDEELCAKECDFECNYGDACVEYDKLCDGKYDCPGGSDELYCPDCFDCNGTYYCLYDHMICDYYAQCPGDQDEADCGYSQSINNYTYVPTGEWVDINITPGSPQHRQNFSNGFLDFTHYVFRGDPGTTLFMELGNYSWSDGPLASLLRIYAGFGTYSTDSTTITAYLDGTGYSSSISDSFNFSLRSDIGYGMIVIPKGMNASVQLRVTAIACESTESLCIGSPHCVNLETDLCNGEYECVYSQEDEFNCDDECDLSCSFESSTCLYYHDDCDGQYDCPAGDDEYGCPGCFECPEFSACILDQFVCDYSNDCYGAADEAESLCKHSDYIMRVNVATDEWVTIVQERRSEDPLEDRGTRASKFYDFYHYVFEADPGTILYVELENITWSESEGGLTPYSRFIAGSGEDPAVSLSNRAYFYSTGYNHTSTSSNVFSLTNSTGFVLLAFPKDADAYVEFRVTAIECEIFTLPCSGSPHCFYLEEWCDGTVQCLDSGEDEYCTTTAPTTSSTISSNTSSPTSPTTTPTTTSISPSPTDTYVNVPVGSEWHEVNNVIGVLQENGDYLEAIWRFHAPSDSYVLLFEVTPAYVLSPGSEVLFGTDPFFDPHVAQIIHFGTDIPFGIYDFYVLNDEAFVSIMVPVDSSTDETSLEFRVRAELHDCAGDQTPCVECSGEICSPVLDCSVSDDYRCPDV